MKDIYFSSFSGEEVDYMIDAVNNMRICVITTGSSAGSNVNCKCTALNYNKTIKADSNGKCIFNIPGYGDYLINDSISQPVYVFKQFQVDLS